jgi:flavin reductase
MARLAAAVNVVSSAGPAGRAGLTASAICSVTDTPPTLLVCINRASRCGEVFRRNGVLCVNVLGPEHESLSRDFATPERDWDSCFAGGAWEYLETGAPALRSAQVAFDCVIRAAHDVGTHSILLSEVVAIRRRSEVGALVYFDRAYHTVTPLQSAGVHGG